MATMQLIRDKTIRSYIQHSDKCIKNWSKKPAISSLLRTIINGYCLPTANNTDGNKLNALDIGCGLGYDSIILSDIGKCNVYAIDAVPQFLEYFKQNIERVEQQNNKKLDIYPIECDFKQILQCQRLTEQKYDVLWNNASLMHLSKREFNQFLSDIHSICTSKTIFGSIFFNGHGSKERYTDVTFVPDRYLSEYTKYELSQMFIRNGWKISLMSPATNYNRKGDWIQILAQQDDTHPNTNFNRHLH